VTRSSNRGGGRSRKNRRPIGSRPNRASYAERTERLGLRTSSNPGDGSRPDWDRPRRLK